MATKNQIEAADSPIAEQAYRALQSYFASQPGQYKRFKSGLAKLVTLKKKDPAAFEDFVRELASDERARVEATKIIKESKAMIGKEVRDLARDLSR